MRKRYKPSGNIVCDPKTGILYSKNGHPPTGLQPITRPVSLILRVDADGSIHTKG